MKQIKIQGFTETITSEYQPAIVAFGIENVGTTRFGTTAPEPIGWIAVDRNSKITVEEQKEKRGLDILVNSKPYISHKDAMRIAMIENPEETKRIYSEAMKRIYEDCMRLAEHPDIQSIVLDRASQIFDYILFAHFGRKNQIETFQRGAPNQDMIDLISALGSKNLVLLCKSSEIWADTGETDKKGNKKQAPTGKMKPDGFGKISQFVTATVELTSKRGKLVGDDDEEKLNQKYKCKIVHCKGNVLLEGQDLSELGVCGEQITWQNVLNVIGVD